MYLTFTLAHRASGSSPLCCRYIIYSSGALRHSGFQFVGWIVGFCGLYYIWNMKGGVMIRYRRCTTRRNQSWDGNQWFERYCRVMKAHELRSIPIWRTRLTNTGKTELRLRAKFPGATDCGCILFFFGFQIKIVVLFKPVTSVSFAKAWRLKWSMVCFSLSILPFVY